MNIKELTKINYRFLKYLDLKNPHDNERDVAGVLQRIIEQDPSLSAPNNLKLLMSEWAASIDLTVEYINAYLRNEAVRIGSGNDFDNWINAQRRTATRIILYRQEKAFKS